MSFTQRLKTLAGRFSPALVARYAFLRRFGRLPRLSHPRDLNEKTMWASLRGDTSGWEMMADKVAVRDYIASLGLADMLSGLLGSWSDPADIDFDALKPPYVLKTNNSSGDIIFVAEGEKIDSAALRRRLGKMLLRPFGLATGEPHYSRIVPRIFAEATWPVDRQDYPSTSLIDYKVICVDGEPAIILVEFDRFKQGAKPFYQVRGIDWENLNRLAAPNDSYRLSNAPIPRPACLDEMKQACRLIARNLPQVRVDFYVIDGKPRFGEITLTGFAYTMDLLSSEALLDLGSRVTLPIDVSTKQSAR